MVGQQAQHNRDAGEYQHDFLLAPTAHFKVVVDRRHLEQALAVGRLEVGDLQDNGQRFDDVDQADQQQDERHFTRKCQTRNRAAEKERAGVAHEYLGGMEVIAQEAQQRTRECRRKDHNAHISAAEADEHEEDGNRQRNACCQTVDAVGQIDGVVRADDNKGREHDIQRPRPAERNACERNPQLWQTARPQEQYEDEHAGNQNLEHQLLLRGSDLRFPFFLILA